MLFNAAQSVLAVAAIVSGIAGVTAHPSAFVVKREGPQIPALNQTEFITDMENITKEFPLGRAPARQLPCRVDVKLGPTWKEGMFERHRLMFKSPRSDIAPMKMIEAASAAWFMTIDRQRYDAKGRCNGGVNNMQLWHDPDMITWYIDWGDWGNERGKSSALCSAKHFKRQWGQWTGCEWDFDWEDFKFKGNNKPE